MSVPLPCCEVFGDVQPELRCHVDPSAIRNGVKDLPRRRSGKSFTPLRMADGSTWHRNSGWTSPKTSQHGRGTDILRSLGCASLAYSSGTTWIGTRRSDEDRVTQSSHRSLSPGWLSVSMCQISKR